MRALLIALMTLVTAPAFGQDAGGWALVSVGGVAAEPGGRIAFSADGAVFGSTGCNRFQSSVISAPGVLTFNSPVATTKMACLGPMQQQETLVLAALEGTVGVAYDPVADRMMLIPQEGAPVLGFVRGD